MLGECTIRKVAGEGGCEKSGREASDPSLTPCQPQDLLQRPSHLMSHPAVNGPFSLTLPGGPDPALLSLPSGICGFLTFGASVDPDVLLSYPSNDMAVAVARAFIILSVLTSYSILHFCGR